MEAGDSVGNKLFALLDGPFDTDLLGLVVGLALAKFGGEGLGDVGAEDAREDRQLVAEDDRLDAGDDGDGDALGAATLDEGEVFRVVEEHLGNEVVGAVADFFLEIEDVGIHVRGLLVFLGIAGHAVGEGSLDALHARAVEEETLVEAVHLLLEVGRMVVIKLRFLFDLEGLDVSAEEEEVVDAEEVEVDQRILRLVLGETLADDVGDGGDAVFILNGGGDGDGAGAFADIHLLEAAVGHAFINVFAVMGGDVDVFRVEFPEFVNHVIDFLYAISPEGR